MSKDDMDLIVFDEGPTDQTETAEDFQFNPSMLFGQPEDQSITTTINLPAYPEGGGDALTVTIHSVLSGPDTSVEVNVEGTPATPDEWYEVVSLIKNMMASRG